MTARPANSYRAARRRIAKKNKLIWRELSRGQVPASLHLRGSKSVAVSPAAGSYGKPREGIAGRSRALA